MTVNEEQHGIRAISRGSSPEKLDSFLGVLAVREQIPVDDPFRSIDERLFSRRRTRHERERNDDRAEPATPHRSPPAASDHSLGAGEPVHRWCGFVETDFASSCGLGTGPMPRIPTRTIFSDFCASPISHMGTSVGYGWRESSRPEPYGGVL
jgi:hypothetical protein